MAGEIPIHEIFLYDHWPGEPNPNLGIPAGGWDNTSISACQTTPAYPPGTKISAYSEFSYCPGHYTMCYMMSFESNTGEFDLAALSEGYGICSDTGGENDTEMATLSGCLGTSVDVTVSKWWIVTNSFTDGDGSETGRFAVGVIDMSSGEFGWFWIGGVCPAIDVTRFDEADDGSGTTLSGAGDVSQGGHLMPVADVTPGGLVAFGCWDGTWEMPPGACALEADN